MKITFEYLGQLRHLAQCDSVSREVVAGTALPDLIVSIATGYDDMFKAILLDDSGNILPSTMILMGDDPVNREEWPILSEGDVITLLPPIAGG